MLIAKYNIILATSALTIASSTFAQSNPADPANDIQQTNLLSFITAGGPVGYFILLLSVAGVALAIDSFLRLKSDRLMPPSLTEEFETLSRQGKFAELLSLAKTNDSMLAKIVATAVARGNLGLDAISETFQDAGKKEITILQQRVGYIGFLAAIAPMLGLLGTVTGMIDAFNVLGSAKGAARPDQLAVGISQAMVTTCMGLILALPFMLIFAILRDKVTRLGLEASGICERLMRSMTVAFDEKRANGQNKSR